MRYARVKQALRIWQNRRLSVLLGLTVSRLAIAAVDKGGRETDLRLERQQRWYVPSNSCAAIASA